MNSDLFIIQMINLKVVTAYIMRFCLHDHGSFMHTVFFCYFIYYVKDSINYFNLLVVQYLGSLRYLYRKCISIYTICIFKTVGINNLQSPITSVTIHYPLNNSVELYNVNVESLI